MLLALVCLWIGFAAGFVCASLMARRPEARHPRARADARARIAVERRRLPERGERAELADADASSEER